jgi:hypothetical protein
LCTGAWVVLALATAACSSSPASDDAGGPGSDSTPDATTDTGSGFATVEAGTCHLQSCASLGYTCGLNADGCGGTVDCGTCTGLDFCGGGGYSKCGHPAADAAVTCPPGTPTTCQKLGYDCGPAADGCGGLLQCGTCSGGDFCGGGGFNRCGDGLPDAGTSAIAGCDGGTATVVGRVVAGTLPAYLPPGGSGDPVPNVLVYVPQGPLQPLSTGAHCAACSAAGSGSPLQTTTAPDGTFAIPNVPIGPSVPIVIQLGQWRRGVTFSVTSGCTTTDVGDIHMPRTQAGDPGDIPNSSNIPATAVSTGNDDAIECLLLKMGIDRNEFTTNAYPGRVHLYTGNGANLGRNTPTETALMGAGGTFMNYDQIIFPCWGVDPVLDTSNVTQKTPAELANLVSYANAGGRFFATHFSFSWLYKNPPFDQTAQWDPEANNNPGYVPFTGNVSTAVPLGFPGTFALWLDVVGALTKAPTPQVTISEGRHNVDKVLGNSVAWIDGVDPSPADASTSQMLLHYSFDTPVGAPAQCGHAIYSDFHVTTQSNTSGMHFPDECDNNQLSAQERILEFMIWDLSSCAGPTKPACVPKTCNQIGVTCGTADDTCGHELNCGSCPAGQTCGGGGVPGKCGGCVPTTCKAQGLECGPAGDGCGNTLACGDCVPGQTCGGGGVAGKCGGTCPVPTTCKDLGYTCGPAGDGCGGVIQCGTCKPPQTCGGSGVPGVCGGLQ